VFGCMLYPIWTETAVSSTVAETAANRRWSVGGESSFFGRSQGVSHDGIFLLGGGAGAGGGGLTRESGSQSCMGSFGPMLKLQHGGHSAGMAV
jgi:hypothetical protein